MVQFSAYLEGDLYRSPRPYEVSIRGGEPRRLHDAFGSRGVRSPDGRRSAFERGGVRPQRRHYRGADRRDIWVHDDSLDTFRKVSPWDGNDMAARWSGNEAVLFLSDRRNDTHNIHRTDLADGSTVALTDFDEIDVASFDATADGNRIVLHRWDSLYGLDLSEPDPVPRPILLNAPEDAGDDTEVLDISNRVGEAALNPDGKSLAVVAYGEVLVRGIADDSPTRRVTRSHGRESEPAWSPDGTTLYFTRTAAGRSTIAAATVVRTREELRSAYTDLTAPPASEESAEEADEPSEDADGAEAEAESESEEAATAAGSAEGADPEASEEASADEKETESEQDEAEQDEAEDEEKDESLDPARWADAIEFTIDTVIETEGDARTARPSPDGLSLAWVRGLGDLMIRDLATGEDTLLRAGWDSGLDFRWSPDSDWIVFWQYDIDFNRDVFIVPADGSAAPVNITRHPDNDGNARFSGDGRILAFSSERNDEEYDAYIVFLDRELERLAEPELDAYFKEQAKAAKGRKPLDPHELRKQLEARRIGEETADAAGESEESEDAGKADEADEAPFTAADLESAYRRLRQVTNLPGSSSSLELMPAGDKILFNYSTGAPGASGLHLIGWNGSDRKRLGDTLSMQGLNLDGTKLVAVDSGRAELIALPGGKATRYSVSQKIRIDLEEQSSEKFLEAAAIMNALFYHPEMKGLDWGALTDRYHDLARRTRTADEFNWVGNRLLGELSASHQGIRAPAEPMDLRESIGRLGVRVEPTGRGYRVISLVPEGPGESSDTPLEVGDEIVGIGLEPLDLEASPPDTISARLRGRVGRETVVSVVRPVEDGEPLELDLLIEPISSRAESMLVYRDTQRARAALVDEWSGGRLGYAHIRGMSQPSLDEFERDLFAAAEGREGLLIDVRDNGGGWTTDRLLASIMVTPHAYTVPRGADPGVTDGYPQDRLFIQRYSLPINMLCNEKSYSNAEIISHAFKTLGRGTLVGQQTHGSVISTGGTSLIDGTTVRLPFRGWYLPDGTDMENNGAMPDIVVEQTPESEVAGEDPQLRAAVEDLLRRLDSEGS
ncbi:MAG: S41 family peptidase [Planctomycetota bacterium]|nr:S41 family peptidase [Planctomycetota bacterium]